MGGRTLADGQGRRADALWRMGGWRMRGQEGGRTLTDGLCALEVVPTAVFFVFFLEFLELGGL